MSRTKYNILGVITARGGSKGIPGKNVKLLGGKPLIAYTIEQAKQSDLITHLVVSTDDEEIARVCREHEAEVPFMRPKELAEDDTTHLPVMQHAITEAEKQNGVTFDYVVIFQPTSPFRTKDDIDGTIQKLIDTGADSAVSVCEWYEAHPTKAKRLEGDDVLPYFDKEASTRRQELAKAYKRSAAVYVMKRDGVMRGKKASDLYGERIVGFVVPAERSIDIDTPRDFALAEWMFEDLKAKGHSF